MSVLACSRSRCTNIMCDNLSHTHGYICIDCMQEFANSDWPLEDIAGFMKTVPGTVCSKNIFNERLDVILGEFPET